MEPGLMRDSVELLLQGMGAVFTFLILLVLATSLMSALVQRYGPAPETGPERGGDVDPLTRKIIQAAIDKHRRR